MTLGQMRSVSEGVKPRDNRSRLRLESIQLCILKGVTEPESGDTE